MQPALDKSEKIYTSDVNNPVGALVHDKDSLLKMVDIERTRAVADMLILSGSTQTCKVSLGKVVTVSFPGNLNISTSPGAFVVTEVIHQVGLDGNYSNTFSGIRAALGYIPVDEPKLPVAAPMRATVVSNADPDGAGRIQVQMQFQKYLNKQTNWIRVSSPDAGGTDYVSKNRGYVFIPEEGDEVMVQFEENDPARPYCAGSLFPETIGQGGFANNHLKTIKTRSGHSIILDDADDTLSITIKDRRGNIIFLDSRGKNITVTTPETMTLNSKNMKINVTENLDITVGMDMNTSVGSNVDTNIGKSSVLTVGEFHYIKAQNMTEEIEENLKIQVHQNFEELSDIRQIQVTGTTDNCQYRTNYNKEW